MSNGCVATKVRQEQAVELRRQGLSYDEIATQLDYANKSGAYHAVHAVLTRNEYTETTALRYEDGLKYDRDEADLRDRAAILLAMGPKWNDQYLKTMAAIDRVMTGRQKLFGTQAPVKAEVRVTSDDTSRLILQLAAEVGLEVGEVAQVIDGEVVPPAVGT